MYIENNCSPRCEKRKKKEKKEMFHHENSVLAKGKRIHSFELGNVAI